MLPNSSIQQYHGVPTLFVNGRPLPAMAYITYVDKAACYRSFGEAGYRLFSCSVCFGDRPINALNRATAMRHGIFEVKGDPHYEYFDGAITRILDAVPDALIFPRLNVSPPAWWEEEHPDECNDTGHHGGPRRFCVSSRVWREDTKEFLRKFFEHVRATPFRDHLVGWQVAGGNTEEWLSTDLAGGQGPASRRAFALASPDDQSTAAYHRFLSVSNAEAVMELAHTVKELTDHRLVVSTFYGYLLEVPSWIHIHHALSRILRCSDIDFLCSPSSYSARLKPELGWPPMTTIDSIKHHGKLYFFEFDTRTHLTGLFRDALPEACPPDAYTEPIWQPLASETDTLNALRMNFAQQMTLGVASWWFDMWGGWYESPAIMGEMKRYLSASEVLMNDEGRDSVAECAVFLDERAYALSLRGNERFTCPHAARMAVLQSGVPADYYELSDFQEVARRYRALFFIVPEATEKLREAEKWCDESNIPWREFAEGECTDDPRPVREFCKAHGLHCYNEDGHAMYVSRNLMAIHGAADGMTGIYLPNSRKITPLFPCGVPLKAREVKVMIRAGETKVFRLEE